MHLIVVCDVNLSTASEGSGISTPQVCSFLDPKCYGHMQDIPQGFSQAKGSLLLWYGWPACSPLGYIPVFCHKLIWFQVQMTVKTKMFSNEAISMKPNQNSSWDCNVVTLFQGTGMQAGRECLLVDLFPECGSSEDRTRSKVVCHTLNISGFCRFSHATCVPSVSLSQIFAKNNSTLFTYGSFAVLFTTESWNYSS